MSEDRESKRRRAGGAKDTGGAPGNGGDLEEEMVPGREVVDNYFKYEGYGGFHERMDVRIPEVNPWNIDNTLTDVERLERSKALFDGASQELDSVIPQALKDRAQRDSAKKEAGMARGVARSACKLLDAALGQAVSRSCLYQHVRPMMGQPGKEISEANKGLLLYQVMEGQVDEYVAEEKEFRVKHPQYVPGAENEALMPADVPAGQVLDEQVSHYAARIEDPAHVARANLNAQHFLLSLRALSGAREGDPSYKALALGMICHHLNGLEGDFNGRDNDAIFEQGHEEIETNDG